MSRQHSENPALSSGWDPEVRRVFDAFVEEGSVYPDFNPTGASVAEQLTSIRLEATKNWYKKNDPAPATEEQMNRFLAALAEYEVVKGGEITVHGWLIDWAHREHEYRFYCDKCRMHYDETVPWEGRNLCLWCWHKVTKRSIPQAKRPPGHNVPFRTWGPHNIDPGTPSSLLP